jgi:hypothetical protein
MMVERKRVGGLQGWSVSQRIYRAPPRYDNLINLRVQMKIYLVLFLVLDIRYPFQLYSGFRFLSDDSS